VRLDEYRRRKHPVELLDEESLGHIPDGHGAGSAGGAPSAADGVETAERAEQVRAALDALPESQRVIVHLHRFEGLTFAQIATALGTTEGAVKLRAFRAYEKLRITLRPLVYPYPHPENPTR
jgi:RNA polymerase sigma-70 factor (ECF subfamily)